MKRTIELIRECEMKFAPTFGQVYKIAGSEALFEFEPTSERDPCATCAFFNPKNDEKSRFCNLFLCRQANSRAIRLDDFGANVSDERDEMKGVAEIIAFVSRVFDECSNRLEIEEAEKDLRLKLGVSQGDYLDDTIAKRVASAKVRVDRNKDDANPVVVPVPINDFLTRFEPKQTLVYRFLNLQCKDSRRDAWFRFERSAGAGHCSQCALAGTNACGKIECRGESGTERGLYGIHAIEVCMVDGKIIDAPKSPRVAPELKQNAAAPKKKTAKPRKKADDAKQEPSDDWKETQATLEGKLPVELTADEERKMDFAKSKDVVDANELFGGDDRLSESEIASALGFQPERATSAQDAGAVSKRVKWEDDLRELEREAAKEDFRAEILRADMKRHQERARKLRSRILEIIKTGSEDYQGDEPLFDATLDTEGGEDDQ